jgi:hypothetical protein
MSDTIRVTCTACNKSIKAPRDAGGRWGSCPGCRARVYIPTPADEIEDIPLAPLEDDGGVREAQEINAALLRAKAAPEGSSGQSKATSKPRPASVDARRIPDLIVTYLLALKESDLDAAQSVTLQLKTAAVPALDRVQQMMVDAMPPAKLGDMPPALYMGFLRKLQQELEA